MVKASHLVHRAGASTWMFWLMLVAALPDSVSAQTPRNLEESRDKLLGLQLSEVSVAERRALKTEGGVRVIDVRGSALRAGIRPRDLILAVNEFPVSSVAEFEAMLAGMPIGRAPALLVRRSGAFSYIIVTSRPH